MQIFLKWGKI